MKQFKLSKEMILWGDSWLNYVMLMAPFADANRGRGKGLGGQDQDGDDGDDVTALNPMEFFKMFGGKENGSKHKG